MELCYEKRQELGFYLVPTLRYLPVYYSYILLHTSHLAKNGLAVALPTGPLLDQQEARGQEKWTVRDNRVNGWQVGWDQGRVTMALGGNCFDTTNCEGYPG